MRPRPRLTPEQNQLLTSLDRIAIPIVEARKMARKDLALQGALKALDNELFLKLPPPVATEEMTREYDRLERQWYARLDEWILENLRDGRLVAFGVPLPITMTSTPHPVPTGLWHKLQLDVGNGTAESPDWSYTRLRIVDVRPMSENGRAKVERVFWVFGQIQMEAIFRQARRSNSRTARTRAGTSSNPDRSTPARGTPDNPVHVFIAGADETVALKTESLRRNTRYGKLDPV